MANSKPEPGLARLQNLRVLAIVFLVINVLWFASRHPVGLVGLPVVLVVDPINLVLLVGIFVLGSRIGNAKKHCPKAFGSKPEEGQVNGTQGAR